MFESLAGRLRGGVPDRLASVLDTDLRDTRRAMEVSLPSLIGGLRDKASEPGGAEELLSLLKGPAGEPVDDVERYLTEHDPRLGAGVLDQVFGSRGETALTSLGKASGLGTKLLAQVMSMLAPVATGWIGQKVVEENFDARELSEYLEEEAQSLDRAGYGKVLGLVAGGTGAGAAAAAASSSSAPLPSNAPTAPTRGIDRPLSTVSDADFEDDITIAAPATPDQIKPSSIPGSAATGGAPPVVIGDGSSMPGAPGVPGSAMPGSVAAPDADFGDVDYGGSDRGGLGWYLVALIALAAVVAIIFIQCTGGDDDPVDDAETSTTTTVDDDTGTTSDAAAPAPDPQADLTRLMNTFPGVTGVINGDTAVITGTVQSSGVLAAAESAALSVEGVNNVDTSGLRIGQGNTLPDVLAANPQLSTLLSLVQSAGLASELSNPQAMTLFAPTNEAFAALPADVLTALEADPGMLTQVLTYHIAVGPFPMEQLGGGGALETIQGENITLAPNEINTFTVNHINDVLTADVPAENGLIHIIDGVLIPKEAGGPGSDAPEPAAPSELSAALDLSPIVFASSSSELTDAGRAELDKVVEYLQENSLEIEIAGHTDTTGDESPNQQLSQERADSVRAYLIDRGIEATSLTAIGYGESDPLVSPEVTEDDKATNRRIEFNVSG